MEAPCSDPTGKCSASKKRRSFLLFDAGYLTPRGWALQLDFGVSPVPLVLQEVTRLTLQSFYVKMRRR
ncbi:hypothetical protein FZC78_10690 [Rossellomorea vietnamensis]|uniref:Uncharacterized protein n=1 Tax=Rossellomorea vietnamensis TaxID=218284 RepID=A0A5D4NUD8_9BACI|nr:hypothetical protein FZC78_10690 [Rossellomorea vietnamensis]